MGKRGEEGEVAKAHRCSHDLEMWFYTHVDVRSLLLLSFEIKIRKLLNDSKLKHREAKPAAHCPVVGAAGFGI